MTTEIYQTEREVVVQLIKGLELRGRDEKTMMKWLGASFELFVGRVDGAVVAVWGLVPLTFLSEQAYLWLYVTDAAKAHRLTVARHSREAVYDMLSIYPKLIGCCLKGQDASVRWLRWLGAEFKEPAGQLLPFEIWRP